MNPIDEFFGLVGFADVLECLRQRNRIFGLPDLFSPRHELVGNL